VDDCLACDLTEGRQEPPGGCIFETEHLRVEHCVGPLGVGTLVVKPRRHLLHVADLSEVEASGLGTVLLHASAVIRELLHPDQTYVCLWSHTGRVPVHIHWVVQPVTQAQMESFDTHGPALQAAMFARGELPDAAAAAAFARNAREIWPS
jgi:diadenosine tetraphosphate (Ap4A) HIT family hydrolase